MDSQPSNVYVFKSHFDAENAVRSLGMSGFLLMVHGSEAEMQHAKSMLEGPIKRLAYEQKLPDEATN
jgi:hypothetical protein